MRARAGPSTAFVDQRAFAQNGRERDDIAVKVTDREDAIGNGRDLPRVVVVFLARPKPRDERRPGGGERAEHQRSGARIRSTANDSYTARRGSVAPNTRRK